MRLKSKTIVAQRGRRGGQKLEPRSNGITNTLTSVAKDNYYIGRKENTLEGTSVEDYLYTAKDGEQYGIFKLSPRECGRLMGVRDSDITKMLSTNSNSQCYKQFGNSIVVPVLMAIFSQLRIKNVPVWNELTEDEREKLIVSKTIDWRTDAEER